MHNLFALVTLERKTCFGRLHRELSLRIWIHNMIAELQPASRAQLVKFGNVAKQDMIRASRWGFEARGRLLPTWGAFCLRGHLRAVGCLLPAWGALGRSVVAKTY